MIGANGKNTPAPWVSYTRAGCNFGTVAGANTELENTLPDLPHVFGAHSPEAKDYTGIAAPFTRRVSGAARKM
jgi:hypothetical protein